MSHGGEVPPTECDCPAEARPLAIPGGMTGGKFVNTGTEKECER